MALNPFFLQGSKNEQRLIQELINEQLKIYGVEVLYLPRKFVNQETIIREVTASKFDDNFSIEAYVSSYEGYNGAGDILSKFGMSLKDELVIIISKDRFEDFIVPFLSAMDSDEIILASRPREGDLIYFPLGNRIFEIKFVEHEKPFYQLGKTYVYELTCELFEYEDEDINTEIVEVDEQIKDQGYITTLNLVGYGRTATAIASINTGYVREIFLNNDGYNYTSVPTITITPAPDGGVSATAKASIKKTVGGFGYSVDSITIINPGVGYTSTPKITISGGGGVGAAATCSIETTSKGVLNVSMTDSGEGYVVLPTITFSSPGIGQTAQGIAVLGKNNSIKSISISNPGVGYTVPPTITISNPSIFTGVGNFIYNESVYGENSNTTGIVKEWNKNSRTLKISLVNSDEIGSGFALGETLVGTISSARYSVGKYENMDLYDKYSQNNEIEIEADKIIDFSQSNPFGNY